MTALKAEVTQTSPSFAGAGASGWKNSREARALQSAPSMGGRFLVASRCPDFNDHGLRCTAADGHHGPHLPLVDGEYEVFHKWAVGRVSLTWVRLQGGEWQLANHGRCRSETHGFRCIRPEGHRGPHWSGAPAAKRKATWS